MLIILDFVGYIHTANIFHCGSENKHLYSCLAISSRITKGLCACTGACVCERNCQQINATVTSAQGRLEEVEKGIFNTWNYTSANTGFTAQSGQVLATDPVEGRTQTNPNAIIKTFKNLCDVK